MPWLETGSPGGPKIITAVTQQLMNMLDYHNSWAVAIEKPRIHTQLLLDVMLYESDISPDSMALLHKQGHEVQTGSAMGSLHNVMHDSPGNWFFYDTRRVVQVLRHIKEDY